MKRLLSIILTFVVSLTLTNVALAKRVDEHPIKVIKVEYINGGKDLQITTNIRNNGTSPFGGIYRVKIIIFDKNGTILCNNTFTDSKLEKQIINTGKELNWKYKLSNAKKGDLTNIKWQAYLSWKGVSIPNNTTSTTKPTLKISKAQYVLENGNKKLQLQGTFTSIGQRYSKINSVNIKIFDAKNVQIANATFNDENLANAIVETNNGLNWTFKIGNPKQGDLSKFKVITNFNYTRIN